VKKINQDDARIKMRKTQLEKTAERLAGARASASPTTSSQEAMDVDQPAPRPVSAVAATESPLHPSLPPKPGTPSKPAAVAETPQQPSPAPPPPPAKELPPDPIIAKYEEVS
jgi:THO complex subunit 1